VCGAASSSFAGLAPTTGAVTNVDIGFFYDRLTPYGDWQQHARWGWVWCPRDVAVGWRPYTVGHWVYTDDYGWLWESDEDWGWACYHYGRWDWDNDLGWFWVPGSYWGPAWVAWRTSPGFIGWCPLPPAVLWQPGVGLAFNGVDLDGIPARRWIFVEVAFFDVPRVHDHLLMVSRSVILVRETRPLVRFEAIDGRIVNRTFTDRQIELLTRRPVTHFRVRHVDNPAAMRVFRERDGEIALFTPRIGRGRAGLAPPRFGEFERREEAERAQLREQQRAEQSREQERHQAELRVPGINRELMQRRQETERQALQREHARQQRQLESRHFRQREEFRGPEARSNALGRGGVETRPDGRFAGTPGSQGRGMRR
jgi:hypothetical protein